MEVSHRQTALRGLLLVLSIVPAWSEAQSSRPVQPTAKTSPEGVASETSFPAGSAPLPQTIRVGSADVPLTDVAPSAEAALSHLQQVLGKTRDPTLARLQDSLDDVSARVATSREETLYVVENARSAAQLYDAAVMWWRDKQELETLNGAVRSEVQSLTDEQRQVREIRQAWSSARKSAEEAALPPGLLALIEQVSQAASAADAALQSTLALLVDLQVRISDNRRTVNDILLQIERGGRRLHRSIFVLDGPPLWSALREGSPYASLQLQARLSSMAFRSRAFGFLSSRRNALLAYLGLLLALGAALSRVRTSLDGQAPEEAPPCSRALRRPYSLAAVIVLSLFQSFFPSAPLEAVRVVQLLLVLPMLLIALAVFEDALRWPVIGVVVFSTLDALTFNMAAGTLARRLVVLLLSAASVAGLWWLLRAQSPALLLLARRYRIAGLGARVALIAMATSLAANIVGAVSLADLLMHGTVWSVYVGMAVYVVYLTFHGLISFLTTTRAGQLSRLVRLHRERVIAGARMLLKLAAWVTWVVSLLAVYQVGPYVLAGLRSALNYEWTAGAVTLSVRDIALFFLVLIVTGVVAKSVRFFLEEELLPRTSLGRGVAQSGSRLIYITLVSLGLYLALAAAGVDLGRATLLTGAIGVGLGFGLQNVVGNFVSGIIISLERPIQVGDTIEIGGLVGKVTAIGFRSTTVRTTDGAEVIVPNSEIVGKSVVNWSLTDQMRRGELRVGVAYGTDPAWMLQLLATVVNSHPDVLKDPEPVIAFERFGEGALEFSARFWTGIDKLSRVRSDLNLLMAEELGKTGVLLPPPKGGGRLLASHATVDDR